MLQARGPGSGAALELGSELARAQRKPVGAALPVTFALTVTTSVVFGGSSPVDPAAKDVDAHT